MKEESGGKKFDQFWEIYKNVRENLVFDYLIYLESVKRLIMSVNNVSAVVDYIWYLSLEFIFIVLSMCFKSIC